MQVPLPCALLALDMMLLNMPTQSTMRMVVNRISKGNYTLTSSIVVEWGYGKESGH